VLVRHVVGHSRPASVPSTFGFFLYRYCYCLVTRKPFKPRRVCATAFVRGIRFQSLIPTGFFLVFRIRRCHRLSGNSVARAFKPATSARPKAAKINLISCSCLCSVVEIGAFFISPEKSLKKFSVMLGMSKAMAGASYSATSNTIKTTYKRTDCSG